MVNYNDPDYVHWGYMSHYTRGISIIDQGLRQLVEAVEADEHYRDNTVFVIVPDCGRDSNPFVSGTVAGFVRLGKVGSRKKGKHKRGREWSE